MRIKNSKGKIYYGLHFYPGVAEYQEPGKDAYRVFLNEDTLRKMDPTFAGRPVFVEHVDDVDENVDELRKEADGWVVESFFNAADGKHWVKFLVCSERGERAIARGMRLSNCYVPNAFDRGGLWNGVSYAKEVRDGEYEHLAIVPNPRYDESVILTPDEFKTYNDDLSIELKRLANHKKGAGKMAFKLFKRAKVENSAIDLEATLVLLPKSNREVSLMQLCNEADEKKANGDHMVDVGGTKMTLNELMDKHKAVCDELEGMKTEKANAAAEADKATENAEDEDDDKKENDDDMENAEDDEKAKITEDKEKEVEKEKAKNGDKKADKKANAATKQAADDLEARRKVAAKEKADRLRNADKRQSEAVASVETGEDKVARGKSRYGSN